MEQIKKSRSINWSENEKNVLKMLILERVEVLENKNTTTNTTLLKKHAWGEVLSRFNAFGLTKRDLSQLQNQWRNMKSRAKKSEFEFRNSQKMTGGGPPPPSPPFEDKQIMHAIPLEFSIDSNVFDSDGFHNQKTKDKEKAVTPIPDEQGPSLEHKSHILTKTKDKEKAVTPIPDEQGPSLEHKSHILTLDLVKNKPAILPTQPEENKEKKNKIHNKRCCPDDHEHELFLLAKKAREQAMHYQKEEHEKKMNILALEEKYWKNKTSNL